MLLVSAFSLCSAAQTALPRAANYPYLLHLETMTFYEDNCVLLRRDGQFHLEHQKGERTRVFEGTLTPAGLLAIQNVIQGDGLAHLRQQQIATPSGYIMLDELYVNIFRGDHWQNLFFPDVPTRKPFDNLVSPLVRWLESLRKEPHRELSEDEGKNDCQLPKRIVLKMRGPNSAAIPVRP